MLLLKSSKDQVLVTQLKVADSLWTRTKGLLGTKELAVGSALWIKNCNSVHTFFMNYSIDCVFIDESMVVKKIFSQLKPWRMTPPVWSAKSVIEMPSGQARQLMIMEGDTLHVGS